MIDRAGARLLALKSARPVCALTLAWLSALTSSCSAPWESAANTDPLPSAGSNAGGAGAIGGGSNAGLNPLGRARCHAPPGVSASPKNTEQAVLLLNALPKPTSSACFLESLDRPLAVYATSSTFSAQPAASSSSPRIFIQIGQLWVSAVMDGDSSYLLEFGTQVAENGSDPPRSIKGELLLPIDAPVAASAPYDRVRLGEGTVCGECHTSEQRDENITFAVAYSSGSFRPRADTQVSVATLRAQAQACSWQLEPHRCEMLSAIFDGGTVEETKFPDSMPTFF